MKHGSLFSGIGGFDLAAQWMGWENKFHCEWNPFGRRVLHYYWPQAESFEDITQSDFIPYANTIDVLTGGFPCQPYSAAGKRKGKEDSRHLWPQMLRAIGEVRPRWIVGENVSGLLTWNEGMVLAEIKADLESLGYKVFTPLHLGAVSVNAPHRRMRVWIIAHTPSGRRGGPWEGIETKDRQTESREQRLLERGSKRLCTHEAFTYSESKRDANREECTRGNKFNDLCNGDATHATKQGLEGRYKTYRGQKPQGERNNLWSNIAADGNQWQDFPTQPPVCSRDDGLSSRLSGITFPKHRNESIKAYGNAIVPQIAYQIFKAIQQYEESL